MILSSKQISHIVDKASSALLSYCMQWNIRATVTGVSGGLDSAVTLALAKKASEIGKKNDYELRTIGLILPCQSDPAHTRLGKKVIEKFGAELIKIDLTGIFERVEEEILKPVAAISTDLSLSSRVTRRRRGVERSRIGRNDKNSVEMTEKITHGNVKARLRMALGTYYVANLVDGLVLSTDNYSEYWMGFWTLHGDVGDFGLIQELWKGDELPAIARHLGVPQEVIDAKPTDGLGIHEGGDEAQLGAPYPIVDHIIRSLQEKGIDLNGSPSQLSNLPKISGIDDCLVKKIAERAIRNSFKRKGPVILRRKDL